MDDFFPFAVTNYWNYLDWFSSWVVIFAIIGKSRLIEIKTIACQIEKWNDM